LLGDVRMIRTWIDPEITELMTAERPARQHTLHRLLHDALGKFTFEDRAGGTFLDAADKPRVVLVDLLFALTSGQHYFGSVDDNNVVAGIDMRGKSWLMLATKAQRND